MNICIADASCELQTKIDCRLDDGIGMLINSFCLCCFSDASLQMWHWILCLVVWWKELKTLRRPAHKEKFMFYHQQFNKDLTYEQRW